METYYLEYKFYCNINNEDYISYEKIVVEGEKVIDRYFHYNTERQMRWIPQTEAHKEKAWRDVQFLIDVDMPWKTTDGGTRRILSPIEVLVIFGKE